MKELDTLTTEVHDMESVIDGAEHLLSDLSDRLKAAATDPAAITALAAEIDSKKSELAAAIAANTPAANPAP